MHGHLNVKLFILLCLNTFLIINNSNHCIWTRKHVHIRKLLVSVIYLGVHFTSIREIDGI